MGIKVPCLPKLAVDGRAMGCCNPRSKPRFVLLRLPSWGRKDVITPTLLSGLQASCLDKNKKGTLIRQMRCFKALLGIQDVLAVVEKHFFSVSYICLRFSLQHLLLKICVVVDLGRIKSTLKRSSPPTVLREFKLKLATCFNYIYLI